MVFDTVLNVHCGCTKCPMMVSDQVIGVALRDVVGDMPVHVSFPFGGVGASSDVALGAWWNWLCIMSSGVCGVWWRWWWLCPQFIKNLDSLCVYQM